MRTEAERPTGSSHRDPSGGREVLLAASDMTAGYGTVPVLRQVNVEVAAGEIVVLLGANGAGKTTTLLCLAGELTPSGGTVTWLGRPIGTPLHQRSRGGLGFVPEERSVLRRLSVNENLRVAGGDVGEVLNMFPELRALARRKAGLLSGGEQQMLAIAMALSRRPKVLLADELSLGLAPLVVERLLTSLRQAADQGLGVLLVEQQVRAALSKADRGYVLRRGQIVMEGDGDDLLGRIDEIQGHYLVRGGAQVDRP